MTESILSPRIARDDLDKPRPDEPPVGTEPFVATRFDDLAILWQAIALFSEIAASGGAATPTVDVGNLRKRLEDAIPDEVLPLLKAELRLVGNWLDGRIPDEQVDPDVAHIRSSGEERWIAIAKYAIEHELDLRGEYYDPETSTWPVVFGSPLFYDDTSVVLERLDGTFVTVLLRDIRWLMPTTAMIKRELADILPFGTVRESE